MKVLGILGSPRRGGNTEILLDKALAGAKAAGAETEKIVLNELNFRPCQECAGCDETGVCVLKDDLRDVYRKVEEADGLILAAPVFFGSLSAQTKMMIDRFQAKWIGKNLLKQPVKKKKTAVFLCAAATDRRDFFENARTIAGHFFSTAGAKSVGELFCPRMDKKEAIIAHPELLEEAFALGRKAAGGQQADPGATRGAV